MIGYLTMLKFYYAKNSAAYAPHILLEDVGADYVVTGAIIRFGSALKVSLKVHETAGAKLLGTEKASAKTVDGLEPRVERAALRLFGTVWDHTRQGLGRPKAAPSTLSKSGRAAIVRFSANVTGARVEVDGVRLCTAPCAKKIPLGTHQNRLSSTNGVS